MLTSHWLACLFYVFGHMAGDKVPTHPFYSQNTPSPTLL
jgi:hypothetical protein